MRKKKLLVILVLGIFLLGRISFYAKQNLTATPNIAKYAKLEVQSLIKNKKMMEGDIIFQITLSSQSMAIQTATKSKYSHCGIIYKDGKNYYVFEAIQPVKITPLDKWIARGKGGHYVIKRLKNADKILTALIIKKMRQEGKKFMGKDYDLTFEWSDDKIYCSELIWKIYKRVLGIEIGKLEKLGDYDLTNGIVKKKLFERYGKNIPLDEDVISPKAIFVSDLLITVANN
jgi:hypothetical protein